LIELFKSRKVQLVILIAGLFLVEVFLAMYTAEQYDMNIWFQTGAWMKSGVNIYLPDNHLGYPPLWALWCLAAYNIHGLLGNSMELWRLMIKLPMIVAQFALAFAVWKFCKIRFDAKTAWKVMLFILTSSFFVFIGVMWGQINILSAFLTFLAFYAIATKRLTAGAVLLGLAVALKIYPIIALPAFLAYIFKNHNWQKAAKFLLASVAVPVAVTLAVFGAYGWDLLPFFKTIFYWAPVYTSTPTQLQGGCMNIWSFAGLLGVDMTKFWVLRFLWIPILGAAVVYWLTRRRLEEADLSLSLISFYILFLVSYSWVTEQLFLDPLPFIFLQILAYRPKRSYLYALAGIQTLVYAFAIFNGASLIFQPLFTKFYPSAIGPIQNLADDNASLAWIIRGVLGLAVSVALVAFLLFLARPELFALKREKGKSSPSEP
jgi:hypothetical protein